MDPAIRDAVTWEKGFQDFPEGPLRWRPVDGDRLECIAVGSVNKVERVQRVCTIPRSFPGVWAQDPTPPPGGTLAMDGQPPEVARKVDAATPIGSTSGTTEAAPPSETEFEARPALVERSGTEEPPRDEIQRVQNLAIAGVKGIEKGDTMEVSEKVVSEPAPLAQTAVM